MRTRGTGRTKSRGRTRGRGRTTGSKRTRRRRDRGIECLEDRKGVEEG